MPHQVRPTRDDHNSGTRTSVAWMLIALVQGIYDLNVHRRTIRLYPQDRLWTLCQCVREPLRKRLHTHQQRLVIGLLGDRLLIGDMIGALARLAEFDAF